jgi:hypothetical protein
MKVNITQENRCRRKRRRKKKINSVIMGKAARYRTWSANIITITRDKGRRTWGTRLGGAKSVANDDASRTVITLPETDRTTSGPFLYPH